jgi:hypothetical protein
MRWKGLITHPSMEKPVQVFGRTEDEVVSVMKKYLKDVPPDADVYIVRIWEQTVTSVKASEFMVLA